MDIDRTDVFFSIFWNKICFKQQFAANISKFSTNSGLGLKIINTKTLGCVSLYGINLFCYTNKLQPRRVFNNIFKIFSLLNASTLFEKKGFFIELDVIGLGFRLEKVIDNIFYLRLGYSSGIYFFIPKGVKVVISVVQKKLFFFGTDVNKINNLISTLYLLRKTNPYRVMGFTKPGKIIRLRTGKQR